MKQFDVLLAEYEQVSFDDIALVPQYSDIKSRKEIDLSVDVLNYKMSLPIFSSPMDTVTNGKTLSVLINNGCSGIIHRYCTIEEQVTMLREAISLSTNAGALYGAAIGVTGDYVTRAQALYENGCNLICIDVAHGHHILVEEAIKQLDRLSWRREVILMAGNVATAEGFVFLQNLGVDLIRVGISSGSICSTFSKTGHGKPLFSSILEISEFFRKRAYFQKKSLLVADGGMKDTGHMVMALAAGADLLMTGSLFSGHEESPGSLIYQNNKPYKVYRGMASASAQEAFKGNYNSNEGVSALVPFKGKLADTIKMLDNGIRSGVSYTGSRNLEEFRQTAVWSRLSSTGTRQLHPHVNQ